MSEERLDNRSAADPGADPMAGREPDHSQNVRESPLGTESPGGTAERRAIGRGFGLRFRITLLVELILVITIVVTTAATTYQVNRLLSEQMEREAQVTVNLLTKSVASASDLLAHVEESLGDQMIVQARLAAYLVAAAEQAGMAADEINLILQDVVANSSVDEFWITDESARAYLTNTGVDFTFSPNAIEQPQASQFFQLLNEQQGSVVQPAQPRESDGQFFKYAGVSGVDQPRIVQVGHQASLLEELGAIHSVQGLVDGAVGRLDVLYAQVVDSEKEPVVSSRDSDEVASGAASEEAATKNKADATQAMASGEPVLRWEREALVVTAPILSTHEGEQTAVGAAIVYFSTENLQRIQRAAILGGLAFGIIQCLLGGFVSYWMAGRIAQPMQDMVRLTQKVADGDLSQQIEVRRQGEVGQLESALGQMTSSLRATILRIRESAHSVGSSATDVDAVVGELNLAAQQQSAAVFETTTAMEQVRTVASQIADGSQSVSDAAAQTQQDVQSGLQAVAETVSRMEEIRTSNEASVGEILALGRKAQQIGTVMNLIDDIAAQTKLIAINASIEAAAAGEAGRRFGVVAAQVRHLADNVAQSTVEIRQRIGEIQVATNELVVAAEQGTKKIGRGVELSHSTQQTLEQISSSADQTSISASQISISTRQQQTAVEQVVEALRDLSAEVTRVATSSNQTAQIVADLGQLSETLNELVSLFDLGDRGE